MQLLALQQIYPKNEVICCVLRMHRVMLFIKRVLIGSILLFYCTISLGILFLTINALMGIFMKSDNIVCITSYS